MKKYLNKITISIAITFSLFGYGIHAYLNKPAGEKPQAGVVVNGDTLVHTPDSTAKDTLK